MAAIALMQASVPADDSADVALAASGDRRAFERLYRSHVGRVLSICTRMCGNRVRGEELTQRFCKGWKSCRSYAADAISSGLPGAVTSADRHKNEARKEAMSRREAKEETPRESIGTQVGRQEDNGGKGKTAEGRETDLWCP